MRVVAESEEREVDREEIHRGIDDGWICLEYVLDEVDVFVMRGICCQKSLKGFFGALGDLQDASFLLLVVIAIQQNQARPC